MNDMAPWWGAGDEIIELPQDTMDYNYNEASGLFPSFGDNMNMNMGAFHGSNNLSMTLQSDGNIYGESARF